MSENAYTLKEDKDTSELHLFVGKFKTNDPEYKCTSSPKSICERTENSNSARNIFSCADDQSARIKCAELGREVCGTCVSSLYKTFNEDN